MKSIKVKNEFGETIEIKRGQEKGVINIRHSDVDSKKFGRYHEFADRLKHPGIAALATKKGIDPNSPELKAAMEAFGGGYMVLHSKTYVLNAAEVALIRTAIKQLG